jgi:hypothetical protein
MTVGATARGFVGTVGVSGGTNIVYDPANNNRCIEFQACGDYGLGLAANAGIVGGINTGSVCSGISYSTGIFATGGAGIAGIGSVKTPADSSGNATPNPSGASLSAGGSQIGAGVGGGVAAGGTKCIMSFPRNFVFQG